METGENGAGGALVLRHVNKENNPEHVNVIHQLLSTAGRNAMDHQVKNKFVTRTFPVQVSLDLHRR